MNWTEQEDMIRTIVLARSAEFDQAEQAIDSVLNDAEKFIRRLGQWRVFLHARQTSKLLLRSVRVQHSSLLLIRLLDPPIVCITSAELMARYRELVSEWDLTVRYARILDKSRLLETIMNESFASGSRRTELRLLHLEIFLLILFPLFHLLFH